MKQYLNQRVTFDKLHKEIMWRKYIFKFTNDIW